MALLRVGRFLPTLWLLTCCMPARVSGFVYEFTFTVEPGEMECFFQPITQTNVMLEVDYQVLDGAGMDITFLLRTQSGEIVRSENQQRAGSHSLKITHIGDYEVCFDNRFSRISSKMVFFELYSEFDDNSFTNGEKAAQIEFEKARIRDTGTGMIEVTVEKIKEVLATVKENVQKIKNIQGIIRGFTRQDRSISEANYTRVNTYSGLYLFAMVSVSLVQVLMIRSLFTTPDEHKIKMAT